ncbi:hypothetical protein P6166_11055 [Stenotrophomonas sp. HITSZ_GD]|uniref:hypothetical protein n=1 Tax=Stenotrophomonas sp. HITSZ_GD TaxID=3037248 RepID=UPI00240E4F84|nr:hypothetical protein [Stenotrophomonas sp. HITSZ_GD]MDG2525891.1 hypothetical protein [Stenotrophomonas sp. HITSZ_GD]
MRELTIAEIAAVNGAGRSCAVPAQTVYCYTPAGSAGYAAVGALKAAAVAGGAVALGVAAVVKLKLFGLAFC